MEENKGNVQSQNTGYDPSMQNNWAAYGYGQNVQGQSQNIGYDPSTQNNWAAYGYGQNVQGQSQNIGYDPSMQNNWAAYGYGQNVQGQSQNIGYDPSTQNNWAAYGYGQNVQERLQLQYQKQAGVQDFQENHVGTDLSGGNPGDKAADGRNGRKLSLRKWIVISASAVIIIAAFFTLMFTIGPFSARYRVRKAVDSFADSLKSGSYYADEYDEWYEQTQDSMLGGVALKVFGGTMDGAGINSENIREISKSLAKEATYKVESITKVDSTKYKVDVKVTNKKLLSVGEVMLKKAGRDATETLVGMASESFLLSVDPRLLAMQFVATALYDFLQGSSIDAVMAMCETAYDETEDTVSGTFEAYVERDGDEWKVAFDDADQENNAVWTYYGLPESDRQSLKDKFNVKKWFE